MRANAWVCGAAVCAVLSGGCGDEESTPTGDGGNTGTGATGSSGGRSDPADVLSGDWVLQSMTISDDTLGADDTPALVGGVTFEKLSATRLRMRVAFGVIGPDDLLTEDPIQEIFEGGVRDDGSFLLETADAVMVMNVAVEGDQVTLTRNVDDPDDTDPSLDAPSRTVATRGSLVSASLVGDWAMTRFAEPGLGEFDAGACIMFDDGSSTIVEQELSIESTGSLSQVFDVRDFSNSDCSGTLASDVIEVRGLARSDGSTLHLHTTQERDGEAQTLYMTYELSADGAEWTRGDSCAPRPRCEEEGPEVIHYEPR